MALVVYAPSYLKLWHVLTFDEQVMPIEAKIMPGTGIQLTGKLGEVIQESAQIALSFIKAHAHLLGLAKTPEEDLLEKKALHLHMPEGGIGKEWVTELCGRHPANAWRSRGPSAGTAILSSLVSLFSKQGIPSDVALTGEITLAGSVLAVGGLKVRKNE